MMNRFRYTMAIVGLATVLAGAPALAQAPLGFTIDPKTGIRGTVVTGQVNPTDVAAHCVTDLAAFQARFTDQVNGPFVGGATEGDLPGTWFPDPNNIVYENANQMAYVLTLLTLEAITSDLNGAAQSALPQTFVMTFAQPDQKPIGTLGHFDPVTGVGSVVVPDLVSGTFPVAATCVGPQFDLDALRAGIEANGAFLAGLGMQFGPDGIFSPEFMAWLQGYLNSSSTDLFELLFGFLNPVGPTLIQNVVTPDALGVQLFTITTPTLGFTIDPTSGLPGETVNGQVNPADVASYCVTDLATFQSRFLSVFTGPFAGGANSGDLFSRFFPSGDFVFDDHDQAAYSLTGFVLLGIAADFDGAAETAFPQTFVMTFADPATQQPVGALGHFDPVTGAGSVVVPPVHPGPWLVAATCVRPLLDVDQLEAGIRKNGAFLQSIGAPADINSPDFQTFIESYIGPGADELAFLNVVGPTLIQNIVQPEAVGAQLFTTLAHVDHFQCYAGRTPGTIGMSVTLSDRFGSRSATVRGSSELCAPADVNGTDPQAVDSPGFLTAYKVSTSSFPPVTGVTAVNRFGSVGLEVKAPKMLLVPSTVSFDGPPASTDGAFLNHFTCYDVRLAIGMAAPAAGTVTVQTAFETVQVQPQSPKRLCVPTSKNGEPVVPSRPENLLCYKTKSAKGPKPAPTAHLSNQFGDQVERLGRRREICVPTDLSS